MPFELEILTPRGTAYRDRVQSAVFPGADGEFGVLSGHEPFAAALRPGKVRIRGQRSRSQSALVSAGFVRVLPDRVTVLVESFEGEPPTGTGT